MRFYKRLKRQESPNLYDRLNIDSNPGRNRKTISRDGNTEVRIRRIFGSLVGVDVSNKTKGFGKRGIYQLVEG